MLLLWTPISSVANAWTPTHQKANNGHQVSTNLLHLEVVDVYFVLVCGILQFINPVTQTHLSYIFVWLINL